MDRNKEEKPESTIVNVEQIHQKNELGDDFIEPDVSEDVFKIILGAIGILIIAISMTSMQESLSQLFLGVALAGGFIAWALIYMKKINHPEMKSVLAKCTGSESSYFGLVKYRMTVSPTDNEDDDLHFYFDRKKKCGYTIGIKYILYYKGNLMDENNREFLYVKEKKI